jgi:hypothetical protein
MALTPTHPSENAALICPLWRRHVARFSAAVDKWPNIHTTRYRTTGAQSR